jgi:broad specificity phosphatase PhoE
MTHNQPIIYIRHGETDWNLNGLIQGSIDTDLNNRGRQQARSLAALMALEKSRWQDFQIVVSPQKRAQQTLQYVLNALGREDFRVDTRVRELGFGIWEAKPFWELKASPVYPAHPEDRFHWRPEGGESYADGIARVNEWRAELMRPTIVVSHGAVGRCLMGTVIGLGARETIELKTPQGAYCELNNGTMNWVDAMEAVETLLPPQR